MNETKNRKKSFPLARWLKRVGVVGFLFFLVKGLFWLIISALAVYFSQ